MADKTDTIKTKLTFDGEAQYKAACKEINSTLKVLNSEMKLVTAEYKGNADSAEALRAKQDVLKKTYDEQAKKVKETEEALKRCHEATGENSEQSKKLETQLNYQKTALIKTEKELEKTAEGLEKTGTAADSMGDEIEDSGNQAEEASGKFGKLKSVMVGTGKAVAGGVAALGTAAVGAAGALAGLTVSGSNYADDVLTISANTGIAADSLQKYQYALNFIDGDMDTLTKTIEKQKQRMGDAAEGNKKIQEEYRRLKVSVKNADGSFRDSEEVYWDVIDALKGVADETERDNLATDLLGRSSKDLRTVIEAGSEAFKAYGEEAESMGAVMGGDNLNALGTFNDKIQQLKAGMGGLKNSASMIALPFLDTMAGEGVDILGDFSSGIQAANGDVGKMSDVVGDTMGKAVGLIAEKLPEFVGMGVNMLQSLVGGLVENLPAITKAAVVIITTLIQGIIQILPQLSDGAVKIILELAKGIGEALPQLIPQLVELMVFVVQTLVDNIPLLIDAALQLITGLAQGIVAAIPVLVEALPEIITAIVMGLAEASPQLIGSAGEIIVALAQGLIMAIPALVSALPQIILSIINGLAKAVPQAAKVGADLIAKVTGVLKELPGKVWNSIKGAVDKVGDWGKNMLKKAKEGIAEVVKGVIKGFKDLPKNIMGIGENLVQGLWNGIKNAKDWVLDKIKGFGSSIVSGIKGIFGIHSPSTVMRDEVGKNLAYGIGEGFEQSMVDVRGQMEKAIPKEFDVKAKTKVTQSKASAYSTIKEETGGSLEAALDRAFEKAGWEPGKLAKEIVKAVKSSGIKVVYRDEVIGELVEDALTKAVFN